MSTRIPVLNQVHITGTVVDDPKVYEPEPGFKIVTFVGETLEERGQKKKVQELRWRAKAFGAKAEELNRQLQKGMWIFIRGRLSPYKKPGQKEQKLTEIDINEYWIFPPPKISAKVTVDETEGEKPTPELGA